MVPLARDAKATSAQRRQSTMRMASQPTVPSSHAGVVPLVCVFG